MRSIIVLLAATLVGAGRSDSPEPAMITYQWKFLEMDGLNWRSTLHPTLQPVARQGSASVWTTSRETASKLAETASKVVGAPRVTSNPDGKSTVFNNQTRKIVSEATREADGPVNHASFVGYVPRLEDIAEGYSAEVTGRKLDQGVLANLTLVDRRITAMHPVALTEALEPKSAEVGKPKAIEITLQVPEYSQTSVSGEWLIPKDGVLVVSLGVHTVADRKGKAVAREYLAVLEACETEVEPASEAVGLVHPDIRILPLATVSRASVNLPPTSVDRPGAANLQMPMASPGLPSRSLPRALDSTGRPVEMPPLPAETTVTMLPGTSDPCASPQARVASPSPTEPLAWRKSTLLDPEAMPAGASAFKLPTKDETLETALNHLRRVDGSDDRAPAPPSCCASAAYCCEDDDDTKTATAPTDAATKSFRFTIPLYAGFKIEVNATIQPKN